MLLKAYEQCTRAWLISLTLAAAGCSSADMPTQSTAPTGMSTSPNAMTAAGNKAVPSTAPAAVGGAGAPAPTMTSAAASGGAGAKAAASSGGAGANANATVAAGSGAAGAGSAGTMSASASGPTFSAVYDALFSNSAAAGCFGCHSGMMNPALNGNFSMITDKAAAYKGLASAKSSPEGMCKDMTRVTAGDPMKSLLYLKISGSPPCGMKMPPGGTPLPADVVTLVKDWIMAGAKDD